MGRPRKNFFFRFEEFPSRAPQDPVRVGDTIRIRENDGFAYTNYLVTQIQPRKDGVTAVKA
jgi:hypothetical protein